METITILKTVIPKSWAPENVNIPAWQHDLAKKVIGIKEESRNKKAK